MIKKVTILGLLVVSASAFGQSNQLPDMSATLENMRAREAAASKILSLPNGSEVLQQLTSICEHAVFSKVKKEKQNQVDILSPNDVALCRSELLIALSKYAEERKQPN